MNEAPETNQTADTLDAMTQWLDADRLLFREGDATEALFILLSGEVELFRRSKRLAKIDQAPICLDELATLLGMPHTFTAVTSAKSQVVRLPADRLRDLGKLSAELAQQLTEAPIKNFAATSRKNEKAFLAKAPPPAPLPKSDRSDASEETPASEGSMSTLPDDVDQSAAQMPGDFEGSEASPSTLGRSDLQRTVIDKINNLQTIPLNEGIQKIINLRIQIQIKLQAIEQKREQLLAPEDLPDKVRGQLRRPALGSRCIPPRATIQKNLDRYALRLEEGHAKTNAAEPNAPHPALLEGWALDIEQGRLLLAWDDLTQPLIEQCVGLGADEPLLEIMGRLGVDAQGLFGLTGYVLALQERSLGELAKSKSYKKQIHAIDEQAAKILGVKRFKPEQKQELAALRENIENARNLLSALQRESAWLEPDMVERFWAAYELLACRLVSDQVDEVDEPFVRAYLRWGLLGCGPRFIETAHARKIINECVEPIRSCTDGMDQSHVYHADEYLQLTAGGYIPPSIDEDLELNQRLSPQWKADRAWRQIIHARTSRNNLEELAHTLEAKAHDHKTKRKQAEVDLDHVEETGSKHRKRRQELTEAIQAHRVETARLSRVVDAIRQKMIPKAEHDGAEAQSRLEEAGHTMTRTSIASQEVAGIRRLSRLVGKPEDPFLPLTLGESFSPDSENLQGRAQVLAELSDAECRDPLIFKEQMISAKRKNQRIYTRHCPVFLILPCRGHSGFCWNPRAGGDPGRIVVPAYTHNGRMLQAMLWMVLGDFRYITSKTSAGVDFLTSDTLAAAYATVRWNYRKRSKDIRDKASINNQETDRKNWRRHYILYMRSAYEAGKHLFHKCPELYESLMKYLDLPDGVERLRKN